MKGKKDTIDQEHKNTLTVDILLFDDIEVLDFSAGISAGIDMSLYLVSKIHGKNVADWTA